MDARLKAYEQILVARRAWEERSLHISPLVQDAPWAPERWGEGCSGWVRALQERDGEEGERDGPPHAGAVARRGVTQGTGRQAGCVPEVETEGSTALGGGSRMQGNLVTTKPAERWGRATQRGAICTLEEF